MVVHFSVNRNIVTSSVSSSYGQVPLTSSHEITKLLMDWSHGDEAALSRLIPMVHLELQRLARTYMNRERSNHTLQTTALINETYIKLIDQKQVQWQNRAHFFGIAAQCMRRILVDYARSHLRAKRGGGANVVALSDAELMTPERSAELIKLDEALESLTLIDKRKSQIIELRFFGGMEMSEIADLLQVSESTVARDWNLARAWLKRELNEQGS